MSEHLRIDKWLWQARFFKSRSLATKFLSQRGARLNGVVVRKPAQEVRVGDMLTFALKKSVKVVKIVGLGTRRGPATEARALYEDLSAPEVSRAEKKTGKTHPFPSGARDEGSGRPTKAQRRAIDRLMGH